LAWEEAPKPEVDADTDVIVRVDATTICGTDLHILSGVKTVKVGDRVLVSCVSVCGTCRFCREGWILGYMIDGTQAQYVRVPFADTSTYPVPAGAAGEDILMLSDILPTAYEVGVLNGAVRPGDVVAVVGAGPIGLSAIIGAACSAQATSSRSTWLTPGWKQRRHSARMSP
jgi:alcohol dehydrogenase